ncbi:MAG: serine hydrolase domain-containing protein [Burkholderiales bacterium]
MTNARRILAGAAILLVAALALGLHFGYRAAAIGTAYKAKVLCSGIFVSHREPKAILDQELSADDLGILQHVDARVGRDAMAVTASLFGMATRTAVYRDRQGCTLQFSDGNPVTSIALPRSGTSRHNHFSELTGAPDADTRRLNAVVEQAFAENDPALPRRTRAILVLHRGRLIAERYSPGFSANTPMPGWSMGKSVINALVGILVEQGRIRLRDPVPIAAWRSPGDPRAKITWEHLLHMESGLQFDESYRNPLSDVMIMLLASPGAADFALTKSLEHEPGTHWKYTSGTTNIVASAIRQVVGEALYPEFPSKTLFDRLGMSSAILETDARGTFVGSSFVYATARDWARFGLLYVQDGIWNGQRILPAGWVKYSATPASHAPGGQYGSHFWLRYPPPPDCKGTHPDFPEDGFHAAGHEGQILTVLPSRQLVIVRLGLTRDPCAWNHHAFVRDVLDAVKG